MGVVFTHGEGISPPRIRHKGRFYLLHEKSQAVDALEIYLNEVEKQLDRKVKVVKVGRSGEYYRRYTMKPGKTQVHLLNSFINVAFLHNTQCLVCHKKWCIRKE